MSEYITDAATSSPDKTTRDEDEGRRSSVKVSQNVYEYSAATPAATVTPSKVQPGGKKVANLWQGILTDVAKRDDSKDSFLVVLGERGSGKRSLIRQINSTLVLGRLKHLPVEQMGSDFSALDFSFLYVKDLNDRENLNQIVSADTNAAKLNIWTLQDDQRGDMLEAVIKPDSLEQLAVTIVLDLDAPWEMMNQLQRWMKVLQQSLFKLLPEMKAGLYEKMKERIEQHIKKYEEPQLDEAGYLIRKRTHDNEKTGEGGSDDEMNLEEARLDMPLPEGVLKVNLGIPIIVVCQKVDLLQHGEKAKFLDQNFDFIQKHIRQYALQFGASVIFTSSLSGKGVDTYYQYLLHRLYDMDFKDKPQTVDKDSLFIPSGFDSLNLINELAKETGRTTGADGAPLEFEDVIKPPHTASAGPGRDRMFGGRTQNNQGTYFECPEWNKLLIDREKDQRHRGPSKSKPNEKTKRDSIIGSAEGIKGLQVAGQSGASPSKRRESAVPMRPNPAALGVSPRGVGPNEGPDAVKGDPAAGTNHPNTTRNQYQKAGGSGAQGTAYFMKLLARKEVDKFKQQRQRQSQLVQAEQAAQLATQIQEEKEKDQMATVGNGDVVDEEHSSIDSQSDNEEQAANAESSAEPKAEEEQPEEETKTEKEVEVSVEKVDEE